MDLILTREQIIPLLTKPPRERNEIEIDQITAYVQSLNEALFKNLTPSQLNLLCSNLLFSTYVKGNARASKIFMKSQMHHFSSSKFFPLQQVIFYQGGPPLDCFVLLSGVVQVYIKTHHLKELSMVAIDAKTSTSLASTVAVSSPAPDLSSHSPALDVRLFLIFFRLLIVSLSMPFSRSFAVPGRAGIYFQMQSAALPSLD
jgi:hypothetical protein